jgi:ABC-type multidrug transport system permease subunit
LVVHVSPAEFLSLIIAFFICSTPSRVKRFHDAISSGVSFLMINFVVSMYL